METRDFDVTDDDLLTLLAMLPDKVVRLIADLLEV